MSELPQGFTKRPSVTGLPDGFVRRETEEKKLGFLRRVGNDLDKRREMYWNINDAYLSGEQSYAEGMLQVVGKVGAGAVLDLIGEVVISGGRGLSTITPDMIEDPIKAGLTGVAHDFLNTKVGQAGLEAARNGVEAWGAFKEKNPRAARNIESVVNIAVLAAPVKGKPKAKVGPIGRRGEKFTASSEAIAKKQKHEFVEDLVSPAKMKAVRVQEVGRTTEAGILKQKTTTLTKAEQEIAEEVTKLSGIAHKKSLQANYNIIQEAVSKESAKLVGILDKWDIPYSKTELKGILENTIKSLADNPLIVGDAAKTAAKIVSKMDDLAFQNKPSLSGLLKARKELDAWMRSQKGPSIFDPKLENAITIALRDVRNTTNKFISERAANITNVQRSLKKQSNLLSAMGNIAPKAADEAGNILLRAWHKGLKLLPLRGEFNQAMAAAFGVGGLGASAMFAPMFTKLAFASIGTYAGYRFLTGPWARKQIGTILKGIDKMIRNTKDANLIRELRADRAILLELIRAAELEGSE